MQELEGDKRATREINYARNRWRKTGDERETGAAKAEERQML